jgi:hypothetical protein
MSVMYGYRVRLHDLMTICATAGVPPTAADIEAHTGIARRTVARILGGETVRGKTARSLAAELGAPVESLFDREQVRD